MSKCKWNYIGHTWENGDEDRYCVNDKCDMCSCPISDDDCSDCELFEVGGEGEWKIKLEQTKN